MARHEVRQGAIGWVLDNMYTSEGRSNACLDEFLQYISRPAIKHRGRNKLDELGEFDEMEGDFYEEEEFFGAGKGCEIRG